MTLAYADAHAALLDSLDARVRESVRRDGVDPQAEVAAVRRIAEQVVSAHDERSLTGQVAPVPDPQAMVGQLVARVSGFGPLQPYLDDPEVEEVWINDPKPAPSQVRSLVHRLSPHGVRSEAEDL